MLQQEDGTNITANALHPGVIQTNLFRHNNVINGNHVIKGNHINSRKYYWILPIKASTSMTSIPVLVQIFKDFGFSGLHAGLVNVLGRLLLKNVQQVIASYLQFQNAWIYVCLATQNAWIWNTIQKSAASTISLYYSKFKKNIKNYFSLYQSYNHILNLTFYNCDDHREQQQLAMRHCIRKLKGWVVNILQTVIFRSQDPKLKTRCWQRSSGISARI